MAVPISAASKKIKPPPPTDSRKLVKSIDLAASSVVIEYMYDKQVHTYKIDGATALMINGVTGKIADVKPGMEVKDYIERDNDDLDSLTLTGFGVDSEATAKTKPKPKPKPSTTAPTT
jgi:hypothetical protein